jgi:hypothetical protein
LDFPATRWGGPSRVIDTEARTVTWQRASAGDWGAYAADVSRRTST